jgi:hypothetical protein
MIFQAELKVQILFDEPLASSWLRKKQGYQAGKLHCAKLPSKCSPGEQIWVSQRGLDYTVKSWGTNIFRGLLPTSVAGHQTPGILHALVAASCKKEDRGQGEGGKNDPNIVCTYE